MSIQIEGELPSYMCNPTTTAARPAISTYPNVEMIRNKFEPSIRPNGESVCGEVMVIYTLSNHKFV